MDVLLVGLLTALPLLPGAYIGYRLGGLRLLVWIRNVVVTWGCGMGVALCGIHFGWQRPFGLVTPVVPGLLTTLLLAWFLAQRRKGSVRRIEIGAVHRNLGALLGAVLGFVFAVVGWQAALLVDNLMTPNVPQAQLEADDSQQPSAAPQTAWAGLAEIAHRGFIQHLPVAGPLTKEMLAVATILRTPKTVRKEFATYKEWDVLADLPSFQAIADDERLFAEIDAAAEGNLVALYRLQKNPLVIEFYHEKPLQAIITNLKASQVASDLAEFQSKTDLHSTPLPSTPLPSKSDP